MRKPHFHVPSTPEGRQALVDALMASNRRTFGNTRMGPEGDPPAVPPAPPAPPAPPEPPAPAGDTGFPADTPVADMTDKQAAAYWKHQSRKHENTVKSRSDYDDLKAKAAEADKLRQAQESASEKAIREAGERATAEERARTAPRLVSAEFRAEAKGVLTAEQVTALLEDLDLTKYLTDKGEVDVDKVAKKVAAFAPAKGGKGGKFPDLGQSQKGGESKPSVARGAARFRERHPNSPLVKRDAG